MSPVLKKPSSVNSSFVFSGMHQYALYTSGTTGRSKGAMLSHGNLSSNAKVLQTYWRWRPGDVLLHALPIFHVHGLFVASHGALLNGSRMIWLPRFDPKEVVKHLPRATVFMGVPTMYVRLLDEPAFDARACAGVRLFISGSAPLLPDTFRAFEQRTGQRILERYGMSETVMLTSNPYDGNRVAGTVGLPLPGVDVRVVAEREHVAHAVARRDRRDPRLVGRAAHHERGRRVVDEVVDLRLAVRGVQRQVHVAGAQGREVQQQRLGRLLDLHRDARARRQAQPHQQVREHRAGAIDVAPRVLEPVVRLDAARVEVGGEARREQREQVLVGAPRGRHPRGHRCVL